jgi:hypothetical protein
MTSAVDTDYLATMRGDLVAVLASLNIAHHDTEPRSLGDAPAAWFGRPTISYEMFDKEIVTDWPLTFAGHPVDPEATTHAFDAELWSLVRAFGAGRKAMVDGQRSVRFVRADPAAGITVGDTEFPVYTIAIQTTVPIGFC